MFLLDFSIEVTSLMTVRHAHEDVFHFLLAASEMICSSYCDASPESLLQGSFLLVLGLLANIDNRMVELATRILHFDTTHVAVDGSYVGLVDTVMTGSC